MGVEKTRAVFLDRDGTLIAEKYYLSDPNEIEVFPSAFQAVREINRSGRLAVVITNQSAVARGLLSPARLEEIHHFLRQQFLKQGARLDGILYCPHHPEEGQEPFRTDCACRKPQPGLFQQAARQFGIDLEKSYMIGDKLEDIEGGHRAGCRCVLVRTGYGLEALHRLNQMTGAADSSSKALGSPDSIACDVLQAVEWILEGELD